MLAAVNTEAHPSNATEVESTWSDSNVEVNIGWVEVICVTLNYHDMGAQDFKCPIITNEPDSFTCAKKWVQELQKEDEDILSAFGSIFDDETSTHIRGVSEGSKDKDLMSVCSTCNKARVLLMNGGH
ncbi:hypothetical protein Tco_0345208 [Tanacetum coccineum]